MTPERRFDPHAAALSAALLDRARELAETLRGIIDAIERDRAEIAERCGPSDLADQLGDAVSQRLAGLVDEAHDLTATLTRFRALAGPADDADRSRPPAGLEPEIRRRPPEGPAAHYVEHGSSMQSAASGALAGVRVGEVRAPEGARLLATQMFVAGSSREDIAERLRRDFGIDGADADAVVGGLLDEPAGGS